MPLNLSANLIIRNTDSANSIHIFEAIHSGVIGTHSYSFDSQGKAIKGVYE